MTVKLTTNPKNQDMNTTFLPVRGDLNHCQIYPVRMQTVQVIKAGQEHFPFMKDAGLGPLPVKIQARYWWDPNYDGGKIRKRYELFTNGIFQAMGDLGFCLAKLNQYRKV